MKKIMTILLSLLIVAGIMMPSITPVMAQTTVRYINEETGEIVEDEVFEDVTDDEDTSDEDINEDDSTTDDEESNPDDGDSDEVEDEEEVDEEEEEEEKITIRELPKRLLKSLNITLPRDGFVIAGDTIQINFTVNARVEAKGHIRVGEEELEVEATQGLFTTKIEASCTVPELEDGEMIQIDFSELTLRRKVNKNIIFGIKEETIIYTMKEYGEEVENRVAFDLEKDALNIECVSSNENGPKISKQGDRVTITITTEKEVEIVDGQIQESILHFETEDGLTHVAEALLSESESIDDLKLYFSVYHPHTDTWSARIERGTGIKFLEALRVESAQMTEYSGKTVVKNGDTAVVSAKFNHEAKNVSLSIGGNEAKVIPGKIVISQMAVTGYADQQKIGFVLTALDEAGNETRYEGVDCLTFFGPIEISGITASSTNASDIYLKDSDSVTVSFKTNHNVHATMSILDTVKEGSGKSFEISRNISGLTDLSQVGYQITLTDEAGNTASAQASPFIYMAPLSGDVSVSHGFTKTEGYLKEGDSITFNVSANHDMKLEDILVAGSGASASGNSASVIMSAEHSEGEIRFSAVMRDEAGNTSLVNRDTGIVYDRTAPVMSINHIENVFSNQDMVVSAKITDTNLDTNDVTFSINGAVTPAKTQGSASESIASFTIVDEGEHVISAQASDLAGNQVVCNNERVIIDKTNPEITLINIDTSSKPVFKSGIRLSDMISVSDSYIKNIQANVTSANGSFGSMSVGMDDALTDEGLMNAEIQSSDMAGNESKRISFSFYVDGTAPKPILSVKETKKMIETDEVAELKEGHTVTVDLDEIWMGDSEADKLTKLNVITVDGNVVDALGDKASSSREVSVGSDARKIVLAAKDSVGNETGDIVYQVKIKETGSNGLFSADIREITHNSDILKTGIKAGVLSAILSVIAGVSAVVIIRKKKAENAE